MLLTTFIPIHLIFAPFFQPISVICTYCGVSFLWYMDCEDLKFFIFFASCCLLIAFKIQCTFLSHLSAGFVFSCPLSCFCFSFSLLLFWQILFYLYSLVVILRFSFVFFAPSVHNCIFTFFFFVKIPFPSLTHTFSLLLSLSLAYYYWSTGTSAIKPSFLLLLFSVCHGKLHKFIF